MNKVIEQDIACNPTLKAALGYQMCSSCYYIGSPNECWMNSKDSCPKCNAYGSPTSFASNLYLIRNFEQMQTTYKHRNEMPEIVKVTCAFITESLLNEAVEIAHRKARKDIGDIIEKSSTRKCNRLGILAGILKTKAVEQSRKDNHLKKFFEDQNKQEFETYKEIFTSWDTLRRCRNDIAHGNLIRKGNNLSEEEAFWTLINFPVLMRWVLNQIS